MSNKVMKLARLLQLLTEKSTDKGVLVCEGDFAVGEEVFLYAEDYEAVPAPDGEYETEDEYIVVEAGIITEIRDKEELPIEQPETEDVTEEEVVVEIEEDEDTPAEEAAEEAADADIDAMKAEIEALKSENETLRAENEELKNKIAEMEQATEPSVEEEDKQEFSKNAGLNDRQKRAASVLKYRNEK